MMLLYPFLTLQEALNDQIPTGQTFYKHADFAQRSVRKKPRFWRTHWINTVTAQRPVFRLRD